MPSLDTIYAQRTIYYGFKNAFESMGHKFYTFTSNDNLKKVLNEVNPDIFMTATHFYYQKYLDLKLLDIYRRNGLFMLTKIDFWNSPILKYRINEAASLKHEKNKIDMIKSGLLGDVFYHVIEQGDPRMEGFYEETSKRFETIPLAADKTIMYYDFDRSFECDITYIGTNLPQKKIFFKERLFPLYNMYNLKIYGQDWKFYEKLLGLMQRTGQYYNIKLLEKIQKPKLKLEDERKIYSSAKISVNIHEDYQRRFGGDVNERFFKILACKGFQITDHVNWIDKYFDSNEIVCAKTKEEWFGKIDHFLDNPEKRKKIAKNGCNKVLKHHTYHNRVNQILQIYKRFERT